MNTPNTQDAQFDELWTHFALYEAQYNKVGSQPALAARRAAIESWLTDFAQSRAQAAPVSVMGGSMPQSQYAGMDGTPAFDLTETAFSKFIRTATDEEKAAVYQVVMERAQQRQDAAILASKEVKA